MVHGKKQNQRLRVGLSKLYQPFLKLSQSKGVKQEETHQALSEFSLPKSTLTKVVHATAQTGGWPSGLAAQMLAV